MSTPRLTGLPVQRDHSDPTQFDNFLQGLWNVQLGRVTRTGALLQRLLARSKLTEAQMESHILPAAILALDEYLEGIAKVVPLPRLSLASVLAVLSRFERSSLVNQSDRDEFWNETFPASCLTVRLSVSPAPVPPRHEPDPRPPPRRPQKEEAEKIQPEDDEFEVEQPVDVQALLTALGGIYGFTAEAVAKLPVPALAQLTYGSQQRIGFETASRLVDYASLMVEETSSEYQPKEPQREAKRIPSVAQAGTLRTDQRELKRNLLSSSAPRPFDDLPLSTGQLLAYDKTTLLTVENWPECDPQRLYRELKEHFAVRLDAKPEKKRIASEILDIVKNQLPAWITNVLEAAAEQRPGKPSSFYLGLLYRTDKQMQELCRKFLVYEKGAKAGETFVNHVEATDTSRPRWQKALALAKTGFQVPAPSSATGANGQTAEEF